MLTINFAHGALDTQKQQELSEGFESHSETQSAPPYHKEKMNWTVQDENGKLIAALTADLLWEWIYIDELWVDDRCRGSGMGRKLIAKVEQYARDNHLSGLWLWTQSWQAEGFYKQMGFEEFTRFDNFPTGHSRIGLRKTLVPPHFEV
ncbi:GNAT family N-acetyltransferase [Vibrio sinensis]|uniref:GNAT family N-acetyltransferase n=1 Tax=Vibrio sinensis TaxID=2302434 RepID=A0A3A6QYF6_9VIBR|nr:GNAT family N-acetyltransferase [Vibrio sinensis]RJX75566.1 GNAT family N-acetyltransferase [Vibrio sinensis]